MRWAGQPTSDQDFPVTNPLALNEQSPDYSAVSALVEQAGQNDPCGVASKRSSGSSLYSEISIKRKPERLHAKIALNRSVFSVFHPYYSIYVAFFSIIN